MTITEFLEECKKLPDNLKKQARKWVKNGVAKKCRCPINAVVFHLTGENITNCWTNNRLRGILRIRDANSIMDAADNPNCNRPLRKRLIKALS